MYTYMIRRLAHGLITILIVVTFVFFLIRLTGDPAALMAGDSATQGDIEAMRRQLGLDRPLYVQYLDYVRGLLRGDLGDSARHRTPALPLVLERMPATVELTGIALVLSLVVAVPVASISATRRNSWADAAARVVAVAGQCVPIFWLGILLILLFSVNLQWLPSGGRGTPAHLLMPSISLSAYTVPMSMRLLRSKLVEVMQADYVRTARAKGLSERVVLYRHAMRNALIPVITVLGMRIGMLLGGAVITEQVFAYPGMGRLALQAISYRDFPVVQAFVMVTAGVIVLLNILVDLLYLVLDPRVRYA